MSKATSFLKLDTDYIMLVPLPDGDKFDIKLYYESVKVKFKPINQVRRVHQLERIFANKFQDVDPQVILDTIKSNWGNSKLKEITSQYKQRITELAAFLAIRLKSESSSRAWEIFQEKKSNGTLIIDDLVADNDDVQDERYPRQHESVVRSLGENQLRLSNELFASSSSKGKASPMKKDMVNLQEEASPQRFSGEKEMASLIQLREDSSPNPRTPHIRSTQDAQAEFDSKAVFKEQYDQAIKTFAQIKRNLEAERDPTLKGIYPNFNNLLGYHGFEKGLKIDNASLAALNHNSSFLVKQTQLDAFTASLMAIANQVMGEALYNSVYLFEMILSITSGKSVRELRELLQSRTNFELEGLRIVFESNKPWCQLKQIYDSENLNVSDSKVFKTPPIGTFIEQIKSQYPQDPPQHLPFVIQLLKKEPQQKLQSLMFCGKQIGSVIFIFPAHNKNQGQPVSSHEIGLLHQLVSVKMTEINFYKRLKIFAVTSQDSICIEDYIRLIFAKKVFELAKDTPLQNINSFVKELRNLKLDDLVEARMLKSMILLLNEEQQQLSQRDRREQPEAESSSDKINKDQHDLILSPQPRKRPIPQGSSPLGSQTLQQENRNQDELEKAIEYYEREVKWLEEKIQKDAIAIRGLTGEYYEILNQEMNQQVARLEKAQALLGELNCRLTSHPKAQNNLNKMIAVASGTIQEQNLGEEEEKSGQPVDRRNQEDLRRRGEIQEVDQLTGEKKNRSQSLNDSLQNYNNDASKRRKLTMSNSATSTDLRTGQEVKRPEQRAQSPERAGVLQASSTKTIGQGQKSRVSETSLQNPSNPGLSPSLQHQDPWNLAYPYKGQIFNDSSQQMPSLQSIVGQVTSAVLQQYQLMNNTFLYQMNNPIHPWFNQQQTTQQKQGFQQPVSPSSRHQSRKIKKEIIDVDQEDQEQTQTKSSIQHTTISTESLENQRQTATFGKNKKKRDHASKQKKSTKRQKQRRFSTSESKKLKRHIQTKQKSQKRRKETEEDQESEDEDDGNEDQDQDDASEEEDDEYYESEDADDNEEEQEDDVAEEQELPNQSESKGTYTE